MNKFSIFQNLHQLLKRPMNAKQQALADQQVVSVMNNLSLAAQETAAGITQIKVGNQQLKLAAQNLQRMV